MLKSKFLLLPIMFFSQCFSGAEEDKSALKEILNMKKVKISKKDSELLSKMNGSRSRCTFYSIVMTVLGGAINMGILVKKYPDANDDHTKIAYFVGAVLGYVLSSIPKTIDQINTWSSVVEEARHYVDVSKVAKYILVADSTTETFENKITGAAVISQGHSNIKITDSALKAIK